MTHSKRTTSRSVRQRRVRPAVRQATVVHVVPNPTGSGVLRASGLVSRDESILQNHDLLSCGPLTRGASLQQWRALREGYLNTVISDDFPRASFSRLPRDLLRNLSALRGADTVMFWLGWSLIDQLLIPWLVGEANVIGADARKFRVMQFDQRRGRGYYVLSVATLNPEELHQLAQEIEAKPVDLEENREAWDAVTSLDPDQLVRFSSGNLTRAPLLKGALASFLERYPNARTGLSCWDYQLLKHCGDVGPRAVRIIGYTMADKMNSNSPDSPGDWYLFARLRRLGDSSLRHPPLRLSGRLSRMRSTEAVLTDVGRDILAGRENFVALNGIDDWVGGVHLNSAKSHVWFYGDGRLSRA